MHVDRAVIAFVLRVAAIVGLAASCILTVGEDGKERRGIEQRFEQGLIVPPPPKNLVFGAGTVRDTITGLEWVREGSPDRLAWNEAKTYCATLALDGGSWRLPSRAELLTVMKDWNDPFSGGHEWYWSADVGVRENTAWALGTDSWLNGNPIETKSRVRCVRGTWK